MKLIALFLTLALIVTAPVHAGGVKDIYTKVEEEIQFYYQAGGEWELDTIDHMEFVGTEGMDYTIVSAQTSIHNVVTGKKAMETCLVTFGHDYSFTSLNCFSK